MSTVETILRLEAENEKLRTALAELSFAGQLLMRKATENPPWPDPLLRESKVTAMVTAAHDQALNRAEALVRLHVEKPSRGLLMGLRELRRKW